MFKLRKLPRVSSIVRGGANAGRGRGGFRGTLGDVISQRLSLLKRFARSIPGCAALHPTPLSTNSLMGERPALCDSTLFRTAQPMRTKTGTSRPDWKRAASDFMSCT